MNVIDQDRHCHSSRRMTVPVLIDNQNITKNPLWFENYLNAIILFVLEDVVAFWPFVQRQAVRDDERGVDVAALDAFQQGAQVAMNVGLPHPEGQPFGEGSAEGKFIQEAAVDAWDRDGAAFATCLDYLAQGVRTIGTQAGFLLCHNDDSADSFPVRFHAYAIDAGVGAAPAGHIFEGLYHICSFVVENFGSALLFRSEERRVGKEC